MEDARTALLFCPPLPPLRVAPGAPVAIGRHPSCEFPIRKSDVSRRHCEVRVEHGRFLVRDLGSTNGTFVNGELVEGDRPLQAGDRIELGAATVTFCRIDGVQADAAAAPGEARTLVVERAETREAFQGDISEIPTFAVLQVLEMGANTGVLEVRGLSGAGRIWFAGGQPVHAATEKLVGFDAAVTVVNTSRGDFRFDPQPQGSEVSIRAGVTDLLLEASRRLDEGEATGL